MLIFEPARKVFVFEVRKNALTVEKSARMKPAGSSDRRLKKRLVVGDIGAGGIALCELAEGFDVHLVDPTESAKLPLDSIEMTVMIRIGIGESGPPPFIR